MTNNSATWINGGYSAYNLSITPLPNGGILTTDTLELTFPSDYSVSTATLTGATVLSTTS